QPPNGKRKRSKAAKTTAWSIRADVAGKLDRGEPAPEAASATEADAPGDGGLWPGYRPKSRKAPRAASSWSRCAPAGCRPPHHRDTHTAEPVPCSVSAPPSAWTPLMTDGP